MTLNHLILILDCSISDAFMQNILIFLNSFTSRTGNEILLLSSENAIFQSFQGRPEWISADRINTESADRIKTDNAGKIWYRFRNMNAAVISNIQKYIVDGKPSKIAKSLALGLLYSNKVLKTPMQANAKFRFLVFSDSSDQADDHIAFMNCVFAAQRKDIPIDICRLTSAKSLYLPQAASLTKGVYMVIDKNNELIHVLMQVFLADVDTRELLALPRNTVTDLRATCFCHMKHVDIGYVCTLCLSVYCNISKSCPTCKNTVSANLPVR